MGQSAKRFLAFYRSQMAFSDISCRTAYVLYRVQCEDFLHFLWEGVEPVTHPLDTALYG